MRYLALATDYDGTIAIDGQMPVEAIAAIVRLRKSGRRAMLVTGRRLDQLLAVCPQIDFVRLCCRRKRSFSLRATHASGNLARQTAARRVY